MALINHGSIPYWPSQHQEISKSYIAPKNIKPVPRLVLGPSSFRFQYGLRFLVGTVRVGSGSTVQFGSRGHWILHLVHTTGLLTVVPEEFFFVLSHVSYGVLPEKRHV